MGDIKFSEILENKKLLRAFDLIILLIFTLFAGVVPHSFGAFKGVVKNVLTDAGADSVSVEKVSVALFKGNVRVEGLHTYKRINEKEYYRTEISNIDIKGNLLALAKFLSFSEEKDLFMEVYERPLEFVGDVFAQITALRAVKKMEIYGAALRFDDGNNAGMSAEGVSMKLFRRGGSLNGDVSVETAIIPSLAKIENFAVKIRSNNKRLEFFDGNAEIFDGKLNVDAAIDLNDLRIIGGNLRVSELDIERFCTETKFISGRLEGRVDVNIELEESALAIDSVKLKGNFSVKELRATDLALQRADIVRRVSRELRVLRFAKVEGDFTFSNRRIWFNEITGTGNVMKFRSVGWFDIDGRLQQDFQGEFSRQFVEGLGRLIRNSFERTADGGGLFECRISGTLDRPHIVVNKREFVRRGVRNVFNRDRRR